MIKCLNIERSVSGRGSNKLPTIGFEMEIYCKIALPLSHRSALALRIETSRFENLRVYERICCYCSDLIKDETRVLFM